jgi:hypothetical protein
METASSIFEVIGNHQKAMETKDESLEEETIRQLSNNKVKVSDKPKKLKNKKVVKNVNKNK